MKKLISKTVLTLVLVLFSYFFIDTRVALFVREAWMSHARFDISVSELPDLLLLFVCVVTGFGWTAYFYRARRGIFDGHTRFFRLIAITVPLAFFLKSVLKIAVGRITTRYWLVHPHYPQFHWFSGGSHFDGFPSGHMAVFTAFAVSLLRYYPQHRVLYASFLALLSIALIATDYHFVSDIIAGGYLGLVVYDVIHDRVTPMLDAREKNG